MTPAALALALSSAVVHAAWNAVLADAEDSQAATAVALLAGAAAFLPVALLTWDVSAAALPYAAGSAVAELAYVALLAAAYARAELSVVYPVARGAAPVLVLAAAGAPSARQAAGVLAVGAGVLAVRGRRTAVAPRDLGLALGVAGCIATYTVIDSHGVDHAAALPYLMLVMGPASVLYAAALGRERVRRAVNRRTVLAGLGVFGAFGLALSALELAPAAAVAAVRETSVVIAVGFGALLLRERVTAGRWLGAGAVVCGVALIAA